MRSRVQLTLAMIVVLFDAGSASSQLIDGFGQPEVPVGGRAYIQRDPQRPSATDHDD